ncbi:MAG: DUF917 family protein [Firmicutes bacterium]|nr:DUF917 family protein [Bacillota bacterium]
MGRLALNQDLLEAAVLGGGFYGGGGGGAPSTGTEMGGLALSLGDPYLVDAGDVPADAVLLTVSAVGAPAAKGRHAKAYHYLKAVELLLKYTGQPVHGFITNECGALATVNGWVQAAAFGLPVVDVPCNGRAHPTGTMGSMGLHLAPGYMSLQVGVGGSVEQGTYVEVFVKGQIEKASAMVRQAAVQAGGLVAVARNPVSAAYAREHGAPGAVLQCVRVGRAILEAGRLSPLAGIEAAADAAGGEVACRGTVLAKDIETAGGFDVGRVVLEDGTDLVFWNEYMTLERSGERLATFPDLITTMDVHAGLPVSTAELQPGQQVAVVVVRKSALRLGAGVKDKGLYSTVEQVTGKEVIKYAFDER